MTASRAQVWLGSGLAALAATLSLAACGSSESSNASNASNANEAQAGGGSSAETESAGPIKVGGIVSITGALTFPDDAKGATAAFDQINEEGGIGGRKIEYILKDDAGEPSTVAQVAHQLVNEDNVVGMAGSMSAGGDCTTNGALYASNHIFVVGMGLQPQCAQLNNFAPVNVGPVASDAVMMIYGYHNLKAKKSCFFGTTTGGSAAIFEAAKPLAESAGVHLSYFAPTESESDSPTSFVVKAKSLGCEALSYAGDEPQNEATLKAEQEQGFKGARLFSSAAYSTSLAEAAGAAAEGMYATSEFVPFTSNAPAVVKMREAFKKHNVPVTFFAEGGYVGAEVFADILKQIKGPITRESVAAQMEKREPVDMPLLEKPWVFGHFPARTVSMVRLEHGKFVPIGSSITLTEAQLEGKK